MTIVNANALPNKRLEDIEFIGVVTDNNCPTQQERVRVRIAGLLDEVPDSDLPWVLPIKDPSSNTSIAYTWDMPDIGSEVLVTFPQGDIYRGRYTGAALHPNLGIPDYPNTYGYVDKFGNQVYTSKVTGDISIIGKGGALVVIKGNGDVDVTAKNIHCNSSGVVQITSTGDTSVNSSGNATITASGNVDVKGASVNVTASGSATVKGANVTVDSSGPVTVSSAVSVAITAPMVALG